MYRATRRAPPLRPMSSDQRERLSSPLALDRRGRAPHEAVSRSQRLRSRLARPPSSPSGAHQRPAAGSLTGARVVLRARKECPGPIGTRATSGPGIVVRCPFWQGGLRPSVAGMRAAYRWSSSPCSQSQRTLSPHKSAFVVPQDATRLNQGHCGSPEDNPVFILPASDPASPNPEGSASRGNPSLVPWMYHDGATAGLVSRMAIGLPIQSTFKVRGCSWSVPRRMHGFSTTNSLPCPRCSSGQPNRRRPRPETSALAQIFSGSSCYERPGRRRKSRS